MTALCFPVPVLLEIVMLDESFRAARDPRNFRMWLPAEGRTNIIAGLASRHLPGRV